MSFALFLAYVFLSFFRPIELFAPDLGVYRPMMWLWAIAFVLALVQAVARRTMAARPLHLGLLAGLGAAIAISQIAAGWSGGAISSLSEFSPAAMLFVLAILNVTSMSRLRATCVVFVAALMLISSLGIYAYHTGQNAKELVMRQNTDAHDDEDALGQDMSAAEVAALVPSRDKTGLYLWRVRGMGFLNDPNDLAQALVFVLALLGAAWRTGQFRRNLLFVLAPGATVLYTVALTQSRGAIVGIASLVFFAVRRRLGTLRTTVMLGGLGVIALVGNTIGGRAFSSQERSAEERIEAWTVGFELVRKYPLFGAGYGNFTDHNGLTAHNSYVLCFSELGLLGYFAWMGLIVLTYKGISLAAETMPSGSDERRYAQHLRSALVGFLTCAWFLSRTYSPTLYFVLALCVSAWWVASRQAEGIELRYRLGHITWRKHTVIMMAISLVAVYGFIVMHRMGG
ncbi:MAG: hypothetical protein RL375_1572 [Pseudomonadota bacterium]